jgi:hypothetical protein
MDFADNKTYTGSFDTYGGLGKNNGSPGTSFFYHTGFLLITPSNLTMMQEAKHHLKNATIHVVINTQSNMYITVKILIWRTCQINSGKKESNFCA